MIRNIILAVCLSLGTTQPSYADHKLTEFKLYKLGVYYPVQVITFITHAPTLVVRYVNRKCYEGLAKRADVGLEEEGLLGGRQNE